MALELHQILPELGQKDIMLVGVVEGKRRAVYDFVPRFHILYPIIHDEKNELYDLYEVGKDRFLMKTLLELRPATVRMYLDNLKAGHGIPQRPMNRLPAAFVLAPGGTISWRWDATHTTDLIDVHEFAHEATKARASQVK